MLRLRGARCWNRILSTHLIQRYIRKRSSWFFTYGVNSISAVEFSWDASRSIRCTFELLVSISRNHCLSSKSIEGLTSGILQRVSLYLQRKPQALCSNGFGKIIVPGKDYKFSSHYMLLHAWSRKRYVTSGRYHSLHCFTIHCAFSLV
ncbi:uncharacterized protein LOC111251794 isoform X3 [Varroa destructor]|uniref:Uncharacterized protein n=1 Tax=Varroa destructor TaxID=109461 RepID=A0A7M7KJH2_VARDE|nr:uncharacterized protein LOC111251794 isoform X3 [Varroa destructor]